MALGVGREVKNPDAGADTGPDDLIDEVRANAPLLTLYADGVSP